VFSSEKDQSLSLLERGNLKNPKKAKAKADVGIVKGGRDDGGRASNEFATITRNLFLPPTRKGSKASAAKRGLGGGVEPPTGEDKSDNPKSRQKAHGVFPSH
jgi:hypothetical protein